MEDIKTFLKDQWGLILFGIGLVWSQISLHFEVKYFKKDTVPQIFAQMEKFETHLIEHDKADLEMKKELTELINRNKVATESTAKETISTLNLMSNDLSVIKNNVNLIMAGKIKDTAQ